MDTTITTLEMCAGYGGIGLGLKNIFGERLRTVAYCELEGFAQANLISKMEKGLLDAAPIWSDLKTFPYESFHGLVDILVAGYPCQPFSSAGKRAGKEDPRHLWPWIADGIRLLQPTMRFFENVEGHISLGLSTVISDLEELGYKVSWGIFSAREVGAPHQRKRVFILAVSNSLGGAAGLSRPSGHFAECGSSMADSIMRGMSRSRNELGDSCEAGQGRTHLEANSHIAWPSRPSEPQHAWEPPRIVGGLAHAGSLGRRGRSDGDAGGLRGEIQTAGSCGCSAEAMGNTIVHGHSAAQISGGPSQSKTEGGMQEPEGGGASMGNASQLFSDGSDNHSRISERSKEIPKSGNASWNELGNSKCICIPTAREHGAMDEASGIPADREGSESAQTNPESGATRERESHWANASECSEIECEVGRDAYEPPIGMDLSKLSGLSNSELAEICEWMVKGENRTDELRLLGNGVVPATATRAFLTLIEELNK